MNYLYIISAIIGICFLVWAFYTIQKTGVQKEQLNNLQKTENNNNAELKSYEDKLKKVDKAFSDSDGPTGFYSSADASSLLSGNIKQYTEDSKTKRAKS